MEIVPVIRTAVMGPAGTLGCLENYALVAFGSDHSSSDEEAPVECLARIMSKDSITFHSP